MNANHGTLNLFDRQCFSLLIFLLDTDISTENSIPEANETVSVSNAPNINDISKPHAASEPVEVGDSKNGILKKSNGANNSVQNQKLLQASEASEHIEGETSRYHT